jgi:inosose dehydratase
MKIGFGSQIWLHDGNPYGFSRMLDEMSLVGLDGFEMCYPFVIEQYEHRIGELRELLAMHDLELASYYTGCSFLPGRVRREVEEVKRRCRFVADLGSQFVLLDGGQKQPGLSATQLDDRIQLIAEHANMLGAYARACGIKLAWHQHWGSIFEVEENLHRLLELTDSDLIGFCPDVGQLALSGFDVVATLKRYAPRIAFVHYKDVTFAGRPRGELWPGGPGLPSDDGAYGIDSRGRWVELGRGAVDFPAITEVLRSAQYDGWLVDDFDFTGYPARQSAQACKDYINHRLGIWSERDKRRGLAPKDAS